MLAQLLIPGLFLFFTTGIQAGQRDSIYSIVNGEKVYRRVQVKPEYVGGTDSLLAFLDRNLHIPPNSKGAVVTATFIIDAGGIIKNPQIFSGTGSNVQYNAEALRVLSIMPPWKPAMRLNKPIACFFTMPISFVVKEKPKGH